MTQQMVGFRNFAKAVKKFPAGDDFIREWAKILHKEA
jgi:hypothetical protein